MAFQTYNLPTHITGDTFRGVTFSVTLNASPLDLTGAAVRMQVRRSKESDEALLDLKQAAGITVTDAAAGEFQIDEQIIDLPEGNHYYDIEFTLANGKRHTYIVGRWQILQDVTRPI
jgi:hypothetical protein